MKGVLILQHERECPTGYLGQLLEDHAIPSDIINVEQEELPDPTGYGAVVALGGAQHVYQEEKYPYFVQEKALIRQLVEQDTPFLGICLGGQLLASALGATVKQHTTPEIGFYNVSLTEEGKQDPLHKGLPGYQKVFHWHEDIFELPPEAIRLATNEHTRNQAFRYGRRAYGLQYHIELDPALLDIWLYQANLEKVLGAEAYATLQRERPAQFQTYHAHTRTIFENFLSMSGLL